MADTLPVRVRFGEFELDLESGELWDGANKTVLQQQPFRLLRMLIEYEGRLASREEIQKKLWPNDTIVDFDHSINAAMQKLRRALNDSADEPRYIETLARRGYRLLVPVEWVRATGDSSSGGVSVGAGTAVRRKAEAVLIGKRVSHYRVIEPIGGGGMGMVFRAEDLKLGRHVALKFLPQELAFDPVALQRFEREAQAASSLDHPNICTIYEVEEHGGQPFIVMQLLEGQTLRDYLLDSESAQQVLPLDRVLDIAIQVADGLQAAHDKGVIHRDIKPANIFLTAAGQVKILDFGLAKLVGGTKQGGTDHPRIGPEEPLPDNRGPVRRNPDESLTRAGSAMGTAGYMSPEQIRGEPLDARTDLFSFGLVLYEMATCQRAFSGQTSEIVEAAILSQSPVPVHELNSTLSQQLEPVIDKALEKNRERRYQSAAEMCADLEGIRRSQEPPAPSFRLRPSPRPKRKLWLAVLLVCALAGATALYWRWKNRPILTDKDSIILADFTNTTSDPVFEEALNTALRVELEQTPFLNLLSPDKVRGTLKSLNYVENEKLTPSLALDICQRSHSKAVVAGSIADVGNRYRVGLKATSCVSGKELAAIEMETDNRDAIVKTLGMAGTELRRKLGEPKASLQKFNKPLDEATSSSPEALQAFAQGAKQKLRYGDVPSTFADFNRAIELDPNFAQAYLRLGIGYLNVHQADLSVQNLRKAYALRGRVTDRDRFAIETFYYIQVTGQADKSIETLTEWTRNYPADFLAHGDLSADLMSLGQYEKAAAEGREAVRLKPVAMAYVNLMTSYVRLNQLDDAKATFDEARANNINDRILHFQRYLVAFLQGDRTGMQEQLAWATGNPGAEDLLLSAQSNTEAYYGHFKKARELSQQAVDSALHAGAPQAAGGWRLDEALREAEIGGTAQAQQQAIQGLMLSTQRNVRASAALAFARAGDLTQAENLCEKLNHDYPLDTWVQNYTLPTIRAAIALQRNNPSEAIDILRVAGPYELGDLEFQSFGSLYPAYVRGEAYLKAGQGQQAAVEFQKMIDHSGIVGNAVIRALTHLQIGRAQAMMGDNTAARKSYEDFLTLWEDADPSIPILKEAKAEYTKLQ